MLSAQNGYRSECGARATDVAQWLGSTTLSRKVGGSNPDFPKSFASLPKAFVTFESMPRETDYPSINTIRSLINISDLSPITSVRLGKKKTQLRSLASRLNQAASSRISKHRAKLFKESLEDTQAAQKTPHGPHAEGRAFAQRKKTKISRHKGSTMLTERSAES